MVNFELSVLNFIQEYIKTPFLDPIMVGITSLGNAGAIWIVAAILFLCCKKYRKVGIMLSIGLILSLLIGNLTLKPLIARIRPFEYRKGIELLISTPTDFSFPSGHTLASFICATILMMKERKVGYGALILAILIAFSRLYLYVHFPTDVLASIVLGAAIGWGSVRISEKFIFKNKSI